MFKKYSHIIYLTLGILIVNLFPSFFLNSGTYFLLDTGFAPFTQFRGFFETTFYWHVTHILSYIFGYAFFSKIFFLGVSLLGIYTGLIISRFIGNLYPNYKGKTLDIIAVLAAAYNPFIYERMISQTGIALGSYLLIIGIILLANSVASNSTLSGILSLKKGKGLQSPNASHLPLHGRIERVIYGLIISISLGVAWMIYPHAILLIFLILGVFALIDYKSILKYILIFLGVIVLNLNWLLGAYVYDSSISTTEKIQSFNQTNIDVFQGNSLSGLGVDITHLLGYGFWGEKYHIISPDDIIPFWYIFSFLMLAIVIYGGYRLYTKNAKLVYILGIIAVIAYILSMGIASPIWGGISEILYENIPFYIGMREPQKWLALTQGVSMLLFVIGAMSIIKSLFAKGRSESMTSRGIKKGLTIFIIILPILCTPAMLIGFWGQLNISDYPDDIFEAKEFITKNITPPRSPSVEGEANESLQGELSSPKILNFPWHSYMSCDWTYGKITANRAKDIYYPANIITSDNIEIAQLYTNSSDEQSRDIDEYIRTKDLQLLQKNNIEYILFSATCADRQNYTFLEEKTDDFEKIFESENIKIYKIRDEK